MHALVLARATEHGCEARNDDARRLPSSAHRVVSLLSRCDHVPDALILTVIDRVVKAIERGAGEPGSICRVTDGKLRR